MTENSTELALIDPRSKPVPTTKILLVEDNAGDVRMVRETLAGQNLAVFQVITADRLGEAMIRLRRERFEAVLLDLSLPDARDLDTLRRMRRSAPASIRHREAARLVGPPGERRASSDVQDIGTHRKQRWSWNFDHCLPP